MLGVPRRTLALTGANSLSAVGQGQFMFVLPWMLLARGHSPAASALAATFVYIPLLAFAIPAGLVADRTNPVKMLRVAVGAMLLASTLYPAASLAGHDAFWLVFVAAVVAGGMRTLAEAAVLRGIADTTVETGLLRAHAVRSTVNQAAVFGGPFIGLLLFRFGGAEAVLAGVCGVNLVALAMLAPVPSIGGERLALGARRPLREGLDSLRGNPRLRAIGWASLTWNVFVGAALGIMPGVLREHVGMDELAASATLVAAAIAVVVLTIPVVRGSQRRVGPIATFVAAVIVQGGALLALALTDAGLAVLASLAYAVFLLSNSSAAASLNGARALEVDMAHQALVSLALISVGLVGFIIGIALAATLLDVLGFGAVLVLIGLGMATTAVGFRRPLVTT